MTDYHKLLGVEKNASKEEIKEGYEKQVEKIKREVVNEKRLNQFLKTFDEAYEALNNLEENKSLTENSEALENATVVMNPKEIQKELEANDKRDNYQSRNNSERKGRSSGRKKNGFTGKGIFKGNDKKKKDNKNQDIDNRLNEKKEEKSRNQKVVEKSAKGKTKPILWLLMLPFKILVLPIIILLSIVILALQIIDIISWIATKLLIVASISAGAIHLYQVNLGQAINYNILTVAGAVLLVSFILPYIMKYVIKAFEKFNNMLKSFVFN